ncbi:MAG: hypothetical protein K6U02_08195 [Firmicutes bacterium]|nr:hypothetical protein [Bacillota bacterium]
MTRQGSLAYYFAAVAVGSLTMAGSLWLERRLTAAPQPGLLNLYFLCLLVGSFPTLIFAFLLRRLMSLRPGAVWQWVLAGVGLSGLLLWGLGSVAQRLRPVLTELLWRALFEGAAVVLATNPWLVLPAGAVTAGVLFHIHRAFTAAGP